MVGRASNGQEAVDRAPALRPAMVLMDLRMREMDGVEAMRQNAGRRNLPTIGEVQADYQRVLHAQTAGLGF